MATPKLRKAAFFSRLGLPVLALLSACGGGSSSARAPTPAAAFAPPTAASGAVSHQAPTPSSFLATAEPPDADTPELPASATANAGQPRPLELKAVRGGQSLFAVSDFADRQGSVARRYDGVKQAWGPVLDLAGEHFVAAFDRPEERFSLITSTGRELCVALYSTQSALAEAKGCMPIRPKALALVGDRIAALEVTTNRVSTKASPAPKTAPKADKKPKNDGHQKADKKADKKKKKKPGKKPEAKKPTSAPKPVTKTKADVVVSLRWISADGHFDEALSETGLRFERAFEGLDVLDAMGDAAGLDLAWYEAATPPKTPVGKARAGALGWAAINTGRLNDQGQYDPTAKKTLIRRGLEWGYVEGARMPTLVSGPQGRFLLTLAGRGATCEATSLGGGPSTLLPKALCATTPPRLGGTPFELVPHLQAVLAEGPAAAPGQRDGYGFVVWAGERGFYLANNVLRSVSLDTGSRDETWPLFEPSAEGAAPPPTVLPSAKGPCPPDMVSVKGALCVDRFEAHLVEQQTNHPISPDYPVTPNLFAYALAEGWTLKNELGDVHGKAFPMPFPPFWQSADQEHPIVPIPRSTKGQRPNGFLTGLVAEAACTAVGKRLCTEDEFVLACRGEDDTLFPYGEDFEDGACNVFREDHPATLLHGNPSIGHLDPRLDRAVGEKGPLLRETGTSPRCASKWGDDAIYDMVGNLDEWVDEAGGAFAGGFFSRSTRSGCDALVTAHPKSYLDYSTGMRCCADPK